MERKIQQRLTDRSLGLDVIITNAPMIKVMGKWALALNQNDYRNAVLKVVAGLPHRLTGDHIRFIRKCFSLTSRDFAKHLGVKHTAVLKWESKSGRATGMAWTTEKEIRMSVFDSLDTSAKRFRDAWRGLKVMPEKTASKGIEIDGKNSAA